MRAALMNHLTTSSPLESTIGARSFLEVSSNVPWTKRIIFIVLSIATVIAIILGCLCCFKHRKASRMRHLSYQKQPVTSSPLQNNNAGLNSEHGGGSEDGNGLSEQPMLPSDSPWKRDTYPTVEPNRAAKTNGPPRLQTLYSAPARTYDRAPTPEHTIELSTRRDGALRQLSLPPRSSSRNNSESFQTTSENFKDSTVGVEPSGQSPLPSRSLLKNNIPRSFNLGGPTNQGCCFTYAEMEAATNNFDEALVIGRGGFGKVYKGEIDNGATQVAIKKCGKSDYGQGEKEFLTEIKQLSTLRHRNLVSLIGYCEENGEMILVYEYMPLGTLRSHLYNTGNPPLPWKARLNICIGAARGLHYLHTGTQQDSIIHRDVKTSNILLDEKWIAKISDFGLAREGPTMNETHVSTYVKGSYGYMDPDYFKTGKLTEKSDVYSFGVVLLEILCARPVLSDNEPLSLARRHYRKGTMDQIIDPFLKSEITSKCLKSFSKTVLECIAINRNDRPSMAQVLLNLESALQLQELAEKRGLVKKLGQSKSALALVGFTSGARPSNTDV